MSGSLPGSSASMSRVCPDSIFRTAFETSMTGIGHSLPRQSSVTSAVSVATENVLLARSSIRPGSQGCRPPARVIFLRTRGTPPPRSPVGEDDQEADHEDDQHGEDDAELEQPAAPPALEPAAEKGGHRLAAEGAGRQRGPHRGGAARAGGRRAPPGPL